MHTTLIKNIGQKNAPFNRSLTINYWKNKAFSVAENILSNSLETLVGRLVFSLDEMTVLLSEVYEEASQLSAEEAAEVCPKVQTLQKTITRQRNRFKGINYMDSRMVQKKFYTLVRLTNRLEARLRKQMYQDAPHIPTPDYIKEKMRANSKKAIINGLS